jgi:predicted GNAT family acetyltransferase
MVAENDVRVIDNADERRYELWVGETRAGAIEYELSSDTIWLIHTELEPSFEGRGLGARLVTGALTDVGARGLELVPVCRFVRTYLQRHPEYEDLTSPGGARRAENGETTLHWRE